ncbi:MAG: pyruvate kinase [Anaerolineales bacterium]|nr:pyruvate kinase [Anaerolineales bacterium]
MERKAKIVATIGPASQDEAVIERLLQAGMNVARLNFSHGTHAEHAAWSARLRAVAGRLGRPLAILQDLQGPKIRVGKLDPPLELAEGQEVILYSTTGDLPTQVGAQALIPVDFPELFTSVQVEGRILLDDGRIALRVAGVGSGHLSARVETGGSLSSHKGINLPGTILDIPAFTGKDAEDLAFGLELGLDGVAVSFVRSARDVLTVRAAIEAARPKKDPLVIAKLERPEALESLDAILQAADGVMVARGDLGVEMAPEDVPVAQKRIIRQANQMGKLVITATQMLESMISNPLPTRAETSDVANAVFDGTDAVMLSAETAVGKYPVESVAMMDRVVRHAEVETDVWGHHEEMKVIREDALAVAYAARELAHDRDVTAIAVFTRTGRSAILMAKARPRVPILAFTPESDTYTRLGFIWGVTSNRVPFADTVEAMLAHVEAALKQSGMVKTGDQVVLVAGFPLKEVRPPNMAFLHTIG